VPGKGKNLQNMDIVDSQEEEVIIIIVV